MCRTFCRSAFAVGRLRGQRQHGCPTLTVESSYPLQYAKQFTVDECTGGYELITIADSQYLVVPQGAAVPEDLPQGTTVLQQPIENIYLVSTSAMDPIISLGALESIALSGTKADGWYLPEAKAAMQAGQIAYAGKYSAPDYETILASGCGLAIENTMIYHTPEVKEQLEKFGIPVLVERSSYETDPLARMEWVKLYGILLGKQQEAEQLFDTQVQRVAHLGGYPLSGNYFLTYLKAGRSDDVTLLAVGVSQQSDECRTIGVVLYGFYRSRYSELVAFEIDDTITLFVTAADLTHGHLTGIVATARFLFCAPEGFSRAGFPP